MIYYNLKLNKYILIDDIGMRYESVAITFVSRF